MDHNTKLELALKAFATSSSATTLSNLPLKTLIDHDLLDCFNDANITITDLVAMGAEKISTALQNSSEHIAKLATLLDRLVGQTSNKSNGTNAHTLLVKPASLDEEPRTVNSAKILQWENPVKLRQASLNSVAAEQMLLSGQQQLSKHPALAEFANMALRDFWPSAIPLAPFIESITFGQLANMPVANLLEKRTFSEQKVNAVLACIEQACNSYRQTTNSKKASNKNVSKQFIPTNSVQIQKNECVSSETEFSATNHHNQIDIEKWPLTTQAYSLLLLKHSVEIGKYWWGNIFLQTLSLKECAELFIAWHQLTLVPDGQKFSASKELFVTHKKSLKILAGALQQSDAVELQNWQVLLKLPVVPLRLFINISHAPTPEQIHYCILRICLASLGGHLTQIIKWESLGYISGNQHNWSLICKQVSRLAKKATHKQLIQILSAFFPLLTDTDLLALSKALKNK